MNIFDNIPEFTAKHFERAEAIQRIADKYSEYITTISMPLVVVMGSYDEGRYKEHHVINIVYYTTSSKFTSSLKCSFINDSFSCYSSLLREVRILLGDYDTD